MCIDEVGRGCGAGPVVAAAVILPKSFHHHYRDSKKLSENKGMKV
jgi:ribonuclease HII